MPNSVTIIHDGDDCHRLQINHRDWMLLSGPGFAEGIAFIQAFGIFDNFTVMHGIPAGSFVYRVGQTLFDAAEALLAGVERDYELLRYDYSYRIGDGRRSYGGGESVRVDGRPGSLSLRPKGYCSITFVDDEQPRVIDLRSSKDFATDAGKVKVYRRKADDTRWLEILPPLLKYLGMRLTMELALEHIDRAGGAGNSLPA